MITDNMYYVRFFHGRNRPDEDLDDWGFDGPLVGPMFISWTYGNIKFSDDTELHHVVVDDDLIPIDGKWYGDFEFIHQGDEIVAGAKEGSNQQNILTLQQFINVNKVG